MSKKPFRDNSKSNTDITSFLWFVYSLTKEIIKPFINVLVLYLSFAFLASKTNDKIIISFITILFLIIFLIIVIYDNRTKNLVEKVINFTFLTLFTSPLLVYSIVLIMKLVKPTLEVIGTQSSWIGFFGSLIGGSLVMFALVFTMQHEKLIHANLSIPILNMQLDTEIVELPIKVTGSSNGDGGFRCAPEVYIKLSNSSKHTAFEIKILSVMVQNYHLFYELEHRTRHNEDQIESISYSFDKVPAVFSNSSVSFPVIVDEILYDGGVLVINTDIEYTDAFKINHYTVTSRIEFHISIDKETIIYNNPEDLAYDHRYVTLKIGEVSSRISKMSIKQY